MLIGRGLLPVSCKEGREGGTWGLCSSLWIDTSSMRGDFNKRQYRSKARSPAPDPRKALVKWWSWKIGCSFERSGEKHLIFNFSTKIDAPWREKHSALGPPCVQWLSISRHCCSKSSITWHLRYGRPQNTDLRIGRFFTIIGKIKDFRFYDPDRCSSTRETQRTWSSMRAMTFLLVDIAVQSQESPDI